MCCNLPLPPPSVVLHPLQDLTFFNSPQGKLTAQILSGYFSSISHFLVFAKICDFPLNSLSSYLSEFICHEEGRCVCFWLHISNMRCSWMINVVVWKYLKTQHFKKQFKILKIRKNEVFCHPFSFSYWTMKPSCTVHVTNIFPDTLWFPYVIFTTNNFQRVCVLSVYMYVHSYFNIFLTAFCPSR